MRNRFILLADLPLIATAAFGAFALRFEWLFVPAHPEFLPFLVAALAVKPIVFYAFGMYGRYWRYASTLDLLAVTLAVSAGSTLMAVFVAAATPVGLTPNFSRQVVLIDWLLTLALAGGLRMSVRVIGDARERGQKGNGDKAPKRILVAGAGEAGTLVVREMQKNPQLGMDPVGFLDDAPGKLGKSIHGIRVLDSLGGLARAVKMYKIDEVVVALPTAAGSVVRALTEQCRAAGVASRAMPGVFELLDGHVSVSRLRTVDISDLLRRTQVVDHPATASYLQDRTVLVTGAGGSIGSELCRQVAFARPACLVLLGHGENSIFDIRSQLAEQYQALRVHSVIADVRDRRRVHEVFERFRPEVVFHAAAHKHVPLMEENPCEAITNNVLGTGNVVQAAETFGVRRLVMISTDKAVAPTSVMGASKRLAESIVREAGRRCGRAFVVVRFGNVLGSRGSVVPYFKKQIESGGPVTVTHPEMKRFFMTIPEAVHLVLVAGGLGAGGELFVLNMGQPVRIDDLARDLIRLSGCDVDAIGIRYTGIRPGEKLEETLWADGATVASTSHAEVFSVNEHDPEAGGTIPLADILAAAESGDAERLQVLLELAVPTYVRPPGRTPARTEAL
jgi:FlaA1/EpsC-like NDP-sugar epimerase